MKVTIENKVVTLKSENDAEATLLFNVVMERKGVSYLKKEPVIHKKEVLRVGIRKQTCAVCGKKVKHIYQHTWYNHTPKVDVAPSLV